MFGRCKFEVSRGTVVSEKRRGGLLVVSNKEDVWGFWMVQECEDKRNEDECFYLPVLKSAIM